MRKLLSLFIVLVLASAGLAQVPRVDRYAVADYIPAGFAVAINSSGFAVIADWLSYNRVVGIAYAAAGSPNLVEVIPTGNYTNTRWSFTAGKPVYLGVSGNLQTRVAIGPSIGLALSTTTVLLLGPGAYENSLKDPEAYYTFVDDFDSDSLGLLYNRWIMTLDSVTVTYHDSINGVNAFNTTGGGLYQRAVLQRPTESVKFIAGQPVTFKQRVALDSAMINAKLFVGLSVRTTAPEDSLNDASVTSGAFFYKAGGDTLIACRSVRGDTAGIGTDNYSNTRTSYEIPRLYGKVAWVTLAIEWDGLSTLTFRINGTSVASVTSTNHIPITKLIPTFAFRNSSAGTRSLLVDYVYINQWRKRQ